MYSNIGIAGHAGGKDYFNWILVRKCVASGPTHGEWNLN